MSETSVEASKSGFADRVAARAEQVRVVWLLLSLLALPFYVLGFVAAVIWLAIRWMFAAVVVGFGDVMSKPGGGDAAG